MSGPCFISGWALETNYPSGANAWNSQPCKVLPTGDIFTPGTPTAPKPLPAEWLNFLFNQQGAAIQALQLSSYLPALQNWYPEQGIGSSPFVVTGLMAGAWDSIGRRWLMLAATVADIYVLASYGMDGNTAAAWTQFTLVSADVSTNASIIADPSTVNVYWISYGQSASGGSVTTGSYTNGTSAGGGTQFFNGVQLSFATSTPLYSQLHAFKGTVFVSIGATSAGGAYVLNASGGSNLLPTTSQVSGEIIFADNSPNGGPNNLCIAMPTQASANTYWTTPDGVTWTARTLSFVGTGNVFGLVWTQDAVGPCFVCGINPGGTSHTNFYRSADGITWTVSGYTSGVVAKGTSLASIGGSSSLYAGLLDLTSGGVSWGQYSPDGGATWYFSQATLTSNLATGVQFWTPRQVVASDTGLMSFNSLWFRFSLSAGVPSAHL